MRRNVIVYPLSQSIFRDYAVHRMSSKTLISVKQERNLYIWQGLRWIVSKAMRNELEKLIFMQLWISDRDENIELNRSRQIYWKLIANPFLLRLIENYRESKKLK